MEAFLYEIGSFQFENLIRNRIPFVLLNMAEPLDGLFPSFHQSHLNGLTVATSPDGALACVRERKLPAEQAIVLLCGDGQDSGRVRPRLLEAGYTNVFVVSGGLGRLRTEL